MSQNNQTTKKKPDMRVAALARFASAITLLNIFGHFYLGFEQSYAHWVVALATGYSVDLLMEFIASKTAKRAPAYAGGFKNFVVFLLPAHITAQAVGMLTYTNTNLMFVVFGVAVALLSKVIFRVSVNGKSRHFLNPSNTGIAILFLVFPAVGSAPPYQFTEATNGYVDWILVGIFISLGSFLNAKFTKKIPLILAWLTAFFLQAVIRTSIFGTATIAALGPMTGVAFFLFTFYMVSDPTTTPMKRNNQIFFGASVAIVYGILMAFHVVFGLFLALFAVCTARGIFFWIQSMRQPAQSAQGNLATAGVTVKPQAQRIPELVNTPSPEMANSNN
jgi:enediyne biosynthesis protein E5